MRSAAYAHPIGVWFTDSESGRSLPTTTNILCESGGNGASVAMCGNGAGLLGRLSG
ncbi:hypothetical protein BH24CHL9_BH24CHL9_15630 [soil metagenome]